MFATSPAAAQWKESLNPAQLEAATAGHGPVLVIAGAGTGKTWTLACRVAFLIENGVPPERILLLTFSRRAAKEMLSRAGRLVDRDRTGKVWGGTFHAIANRLLRIYGRALDLSPDFTVLDQADMADLMDLIRGEQHPVRDKKERRFPRKDTLVAIYSRMVNASEALSSVLEHAFPWCRDAADGIRAIFAEYTRRKRAQNVLDYDDLLLYWRALGATPTGIDVARQFDHVLVDEYQDTNPLQAQILQSLRADNRNLMVVGDDAQAIYAFRAATVRNILDFPLHFPGARRITLEQNYRSTRPILDVSNAVIAQARERFPKNLWPVRSGGARPVLLTCTDENEQCTQVCDQILEHREQCVELRRQAVLFRTGHHSDLLELELMRRNIPFVKYGGLKFLESAHIKDALAVLRLLENPRDEVSWFRVLQLLDGIGPASARAIMQSLGVRSNPTDPLRTLLDTPPRVPEAAAAGFESLRSVFADCLPGSGSGSGFGSGPGSSFGSSSGTGVGARSGTGSGTSSGVGSGPGSGVGSGPGSSIGSSSATGVGAMSGSGPGSSSGTGTGSGTSSGTGSGTSSGSSSGTSSGSSSGTSSGSGSGTGFGSLPPSAEIARIRLFCEPIINERYSSAQARLQDIEQLELAAGAYTSRGRFLSELALDPPTSTSDLAGPPLLDEDYLILSTVHSAKGGEWDVVHVIHAADGMIPSDMATGDQDEIEEERRLFYVALTRARNNLYVYFPLRFYRRPRGLDDAHHFAQLTRFLPESVQTLFDRRGATPAVFKSPTPPAARAHVDNLLASLWEA